MPALWETARRASDCPKAQASRGYSQRTEVQCSRDRGSRGKQLRAQTPELGCLVRILSLPMTICVVLGKLHNFYVP